MASKHQIISHFDKDFTPFFEKYVARIEKAGSSQAMAICPFHEDHTPSLSINTENGLFNCKGCGANGDIFTFMSRLRGLNGDFGAVVELIAKEFGILVESDASPVSEHRLKENQPSKVYVYEDEEGAPLFEVCRYEPKRFLQRRPNGKGGYEYNLDGVRRVPYHLPNILGSDYAIIVEGEKDADALHEMGFYGTTNPMGAGKWRQEYNQYFRNRDVYIIPDNDEPGRQHALHVAESLYSVANWVKIIELPDLPEKGDVSDWLGRFDSMEEKDSNLLRLMEETSPHTPAATFKPESNITRCWNALDLMRQDFPEPRWVLPDIIAQGLTIFAGKPKIGKSIFVLSLALAVAMGSLALGFKTVEASPVIYYALEDTPRRLQERVSKMLNGQSAPANFWMYTECPRMENGGLDFIERSLNEHPGTRLVIIDTLAMLRTLRSNSRDAYQWDHDTISKIKRLADKFDTSIIIVHHCRKQGSNDPFDTISGTLGIIGAADGVMVLDRGTFNTDATLCVAGRDVRRAGYAMAFEPETLKWKILGDAEEFQNTKMQQEIFDAIKSSPEPLSPKKITELTGLQYIYVRKTLSMMANKGAVQKHDHGKYTLSKSEKA